ncbi:Carotenoid cleavage dioxygenase [Halovenus aranensis]|uniref:Carotenoid cleavage dioxygenase n=1 Tax=Halovenus aranensis TaxID=890420 RepID=A0A1G8UXC2_9EURY|nr:carotenoid oxygenase family protein [Halovenus aranensis]SDJ57570.1 Carotenoid cleavage dioxygenase [Halovenus aranensis]
MSDANFTPGFQSLEEEVSRRQLPVEGEIPAWLSGRLVRNGPAKFEGGGERVVHWFDGLGMVRSYEFDDGGVYYTNRFLRTESYADAMAGRPTGQFATGERGLQKLLGWLRRLGPPEPTDNANVHVARLGGEYVALTEVPRWTRFGDALETRGEFAFRDLLEYDMITAHLVADPRGGHLGHALSFGRTHEYRLFRIPEGTRRREEIAAIPTDTPAYIHSIGVSETQIVLVETPLQIDVLAALSPFTEGFFDLLQWDDSQDTTVYVVSRETGEVTTETTVPSFFTFHIVNAFDDAGDVVVDLVAFDDDQIVQALSLAELDEAGFAGAPPGRLVRYRVSADGGVTARQRYDGGIELPTVPRQARTRRHRYVYGQATDRKGANGLVKVDTDRESASEVWERDLYIEEPRMVEHPDPDHEDDGVVLAPALDVAAEQSVLLCLDAATLSELGRARLPHPVPFGFHGRFFDD